MRDLGAVAWDAGCFMLVLLAAGVVLAACLLGALALLELAESGWHLLQGTACRLLRRREPPLLLGPLVYLLTALTLLLVGGVLCRM